MLVLRKVQFLHFNWHIKVSHGEKEHNNLNLITFLTNRLTSIDKWYSLTKYSKYLQYFCCIFTSLYNGDKMSHVDNTVHMPQRRSAVKSRDKKHIIYIVLSHWFTYAVMYCMSFPHPAICTLHYANDTFYRVAQKIWHHFFSVHLKFILTDFQNYLTVRIRRKFVIILLLKIPPHLKCVSTCPLPCVMSVY